MPSQSKTQYRLMSMVKAYKKGKLKNASKKVKQMAKSLTLDQVQDFLKSNYQKLPEGELKLLELI